MIPWSHSEFYRAEPTHLLEVKDYQEEEDSALQEDLELTLLI